MADGATSNSNSKKVGSNFLLHFTPNFRLQNLSHFILGPAIFDVQIFAIQIFAAQVLLLNF